MRRLAPLAALLLAGCPWFTDFKEQPRLEPWEVTLSDTMRGIRRAQVTPRANPQFSVPIYGSATPAYLVSYSPLPATVDSMSPLQNPNPVTDSSLANGRRYYQINCAVCHGVKGDGAGPIVQFGYPAPSLLTPVASGYTDGYLYGMIRNGRGLMPSYARIEEPDRWDVVNYLRGLQGRLGRQVSTDPAGTPGQNGATVPGFTVSAPTRPAPFFSPARIRQSGTAVPADTGVGARPAAEPQPGGVRPPGDTARATRPPTPPATQTPPTGGRP